MARKGEDPMSGLLSNVGGIDSSLFEKPQPMKDMRASTSPVRKETRPILYTHQSESQPSSATLQPRKATAQVQGAKNSAQAKRGTSQEGTKAPSDSNRQLDALLGGEVFSKEARPMRPKPGSEQGTASEAISTSPQQKFLRPEEPAPASYRAGSQEDLESVFGHKALDSRQQAAGSASDDPFALFGGLGTTEQAGSSAPIEDDFLGVRVSSPSASNGSIQRERTVSPTISHHRAVNSGGSEDWGGLMGASSGLSSPLSSTIVHEGAQDGFSPTTSYVSPRETPDTRHRHTVSPDRVSARLATGPSEPPPPSYESATRGKGISSPRSRTTGHGSGKYRIYRDGDGGDDFDGFGAASPRSSGGYSHYRSSSFEKGQHRMKHQHQAQAPQQEQIKDQAKQWLSAGQKWLSGAGKKVAQAVKETQAQFNSRLEEHDGRPSQPEGSMPPAAASQKRRSRGSGTGSGGSSVADIPAYYYEWAKTIEQLPAHEQGLTLAAMPEEDASTIQRIFRHNNRRRSMDETETAMLAEAQRRSLSTAKGPAASRAGSAEAQATPTGGFPTRHVRSSSQEGAVQAGTSNGQLGRQAQRPQAGEPPHSTDLMGLDAERRPQRPQPPAKLEAADKPHSNQDDLLGMPGQAADAQAARQSQVAGGGSKAPAEPDFFDLSAEAQPVSSPDAFKDVFGAAKQGSTGQADVPQDLQELFGGQPASGQGTRQGKAVGAMIDFGDEAGAAGHEGLYQPGLHDEEVAGEPEARKVARRKRLAEMHARMQKQLAEKQARDSAELQQQEAQQQLRAYHRDRIEAWKSGKKDNIRALLSTVHTVLWENSGWTPPQMTDLVEASKVKRSYMKANLVVHPDKVKQKGGTVEQIVIADMAFDTLKMAWAKFEATELRSR